MLCEICKKNEATIQMMVFSANGPRQMNICEACSKERSDVKVGIEIPMDGSMLVNPENLDKIFGGIIKQILQADEDGNLNLDMMKNLGVTDIGSDDEDENTIQPKEKPNSDLKCRACGTSYSEYLATERLGCDYCYEAFRSELKASDDGSLVDSLKNFATSDAYALENRIKSLQGDLEIALAIEDYEHAASVRDALKVLISESEVK